MHKHLFLENLGHDDRAFLVNDRHYIDGIRTSQVMTFVWDSPHYKACRVCDGGWGKR